MGPETEGSREEGRDRSGTGDRPRTRLLHPDRTPAPTGDPEPPGSSSTLATLSRSQTEL